MRNLSERLDPLFKPQHVAVIGASRVPGKHGHRVIGNLARLGYSGRVSLINPAGGEIDGAPCYPSIEQAPGPVDCAIIVIPAEHVVEAVRQCAKAGTRAVVIAGVGFAELGTDIGRRRQQEILDIVRAHDMALLGPNTNGIFNRSCRLSLGTNTSHGEPIEAGVISVVSHSGALFNHFARRLRALGAGLSKFVPVGNEADLSMLDILDYLVEDDETQVIGMIIEGITDGARFRNLAEKARDKGKPIVALKLGRSRIGAESSVAHSSRLAGEARAYDALFRLCGVASVPTIEGLAGGCALLAGRGTESGDQRLICIANSGAGAALLADFAERYDIPLIGDDHGNWQEPIAGLIAAIGTRAAIRHPIDTGNLGNVRLLQDVLDALSRGGAVGPMVVFSHTILTPGRAEADAKVIIERRRRHGAPTIVLTPGGLGETIETLFTENGVPVFRDTATAFDSLKCHFATLPAPTLPDATMPEATPANLRLSDQSRAAIDTVLEAAGPGTVLSETASATVLRAAGIPMVESHGVDTLAKAQTMAANLGFPVVLKALAPGVAHKNRLGLVIANIANEAALTQAYARIEERIAAAGFARAEVPVIVQPMVRAAAELILGVTHDPALGHFLIVGLGGIHTEVLDQSITIPLPFPPAVGRRFIEASRLGRLVKAIDDHLLDAIMTVIGGLQALIAERGSAVAAVDINPLLINPSACLAVDALVVTR